MNTSRRILLALVVILSACTSTTEPAPRMIHVPAARHEPLPPALGRLKP